MQFRHTHPVNHFTSVNTIVTLLLWTSYVYLENYKVREVRGSQRIATEITKQKLHTSPTDDSDFLLFEV